MSLVRFRFWALYMREWLSGRASPCQGEGREFESRLALFVSIRHRSNFIGSGYFMREWLSGRASPCQGEGREFESRLALSTYPAFWKTLYHMREWLSGRASPCQGEGREFESRLALFQRVSFGCSLFLFNFFVRIFWGNDTLLHCIL